jgi:hypothetical protein
MTQLHVHSAKGSGLMFGTVPMISLLLAGMTATPVLSLDLTQRSTETLTQPIAQRGSVRGAAGQTADWTLSFEANNPSGEQIAFDLDLLETETTADRRATVARGKQIGNLNLIRGDGRSVALDSYRWTIDDQSKVYVGKSGYKYVLLLYSYGRTSSKSYNLKIVCQTRSAAASCQLSDNGPLLNQEIVSQGKLDFGPAVARPSRTVSLPSDSDSSDIATGALKNIAPEVTPDRPLEAAILAQFSEQDQNTQTFRYVHNRLDLNGDGDPEVFAYLENSSFCDGSRCPLLVFSPQPSGYKLLTKLPLISPPVIVNDSKTWGWHDLVVVDGGADAQYRRLRYTGQQYPQSLSAAEPFSPSRVSGRALLSDRATLSPKKRNIAPARSSAPAPRRAVSGQGSLRVYPSADQRTEQDFPLTAVQGAEFPSTQLTLTVEEPRRTVKIRGKSMAASSEGYQFVISAIDNQPAQGKLFVSRNGSLRTLTPVFMGSADQQLSLTFRAKSVSR